MTRETDDLLAAKERYEKTLLSLPNVTGVDVGFKYVGGERTDELAIRVFVSRKGNVAQADAVPAAIEDFKTDVIEEPEVELQFLRIPVDQAVIQAAAAVNPLAGGISVGPCRAIGGFIYVGTLGAIVQNSAGVPLALSNFHVLCVDNQWQPGDAIAQPGRVDGGSCPGDTIGVISAGCLATKYNCGGNQVDAAVSTITSRGVSTNIVGIGNITGTTAPVPGTPVQKQGRTTGRTFGTIDGIGRTVTIDYGDGIGQVTLQNQVSVVPDTTRNPRFSDHGDSGSVVVTDGVQVVGLLFAGANDGSRTYANAFADVQAALGVQLYSGAPDAAGATSTVGFSNQMHVCYMDGQGKLWDVYYAGAWHVQQLTGTGGLTNGPVAAGGLSTIVYANQMHVCYVDGSGKIWDAYYAGGWNLQQVTGAGGLTNGPAVAAGGELSTVVYADQMHICYVDGNGKIWDAFYAGGWNLQQLNLGGVTNGPAAAGGTLSTIVYSNQMHVCYLDGSGNIRDAYYAGSWNLQQLTGAGGLTNGPAAAAGGELSTVVYSNQMHVCYVDGSGKIWDAYYAGGWNLQQLTGAGGLTNGPAAASSELSTVVYSNQMHVCYLDLNGTVQDAFYAGSWILQQLTGSGGLTNGPAAAGDLSTIVYSNQMHVCYTDRSSRIQDAFYAGSWILQQLTGV